METFKDKMLRLRYRWSLQQFLAELLAKRWMDGIIPVLMMIAMIIVFSQVIPKYLSLDNLASMGRDFADIGFVALAMAIVIMAGGIDLSVASMFALTNIVVIILFQVYQWPMSAIIPAALILGAIMGAFNGVFTGFLKTRAFLTTLVTLIVFRAIVNILNQKYAMEIAMGANTNKFLDFLGSGDILGFPTNVVLLLALACLGHIFLTRSRLGWHLYAVGGLRRGARRAGIPIERLVFFTYVFSGILSALGGVFYAARLGSAAADTGQGIEIVILAAVVLGGVSLAGGKGTVFRALIGLTIVLVLQNGLLRLGLAGAVGGMFLGFILLLAVGADVKWLKNLYKTVQKIYVVPTYLPLPPTQDIHRGSGTVFELNTRLTNAQAIGLGQLDGPEDVILDRQGRVYCGCRQGTVVRLSGDNFEKTEIFARTGGRPLGLAFDKDDNLIVCVAGMGLYGVRPNGEVFKLTDETNRTLWKLQDDSRISMADDLDIAPDGKVYFSEATNRYEMHNFQLDGIECRGNGRILCYDPSKDKTRTIIRNLVFPNGICIAHDGQSFYFAETWACRVSRYWIAGPKKGRVEPFIDFLPGLPDNINRASDGTYWLALVGMRQPAFDLALKMTGFRKLMVKRIPLDEWLFPNFNIGGVVKFNDQGEIIESLYDMTCEAHPVVTSMREHRGYLYLGGIYNNRIGRIKLDGMDPDWLGPESYWSKRS